MFVLEYGAWDPTLHQGFLGLGYYYEGMSAIDIAVELRAHAVAKYATKPVVNLTDHGWGPYASAVAADIEPNDPRKWRFYWLWFQIP